MDAGMATVLAAGVTGVLLILGSVIAWWLRRQDKRSDELQAQIGKQQARIEKLEARDRLGWIYIQRLIMSHTKNAPGVALPDPPDGYLDYE